MDAANTPHKAKKHLGQNFLHDQNVIRKIVAMIAPKQDDKLIEIGPGLGALTTAILPLVSKLEVIELDRDVIPALLQACAGLGELAIHQQDALTYDFNQHTAPIRVVGNLPYNISSPLLFHLMQFTPLIKDMHFMLQKEVVDRMAAAPNSDHYGRLSVMLQYHCQIQALFTVYPGSFRPAPKVDSAIVRLIPHATLPHRADDYACFANVVKHAFGQRRKTLRNALREVCNLEDFSAANIDPRLRAEVLAVADFVRLANVVYKK